MNTYWLVNPLTNTTFAPFALLLLTVFVGAGVALLAVQRTRTVALNGGTVAQADTTSGQVLWQRYRTWTMIAFLFVAAAFAGPLAIAVLCAFVCWQGGREYTQLTEMSVGHYALLVIMGWITLVTVLVWGPTLLASAPILAFFVTALLMLLPLHAQDAADKRGNDDTHIKRRFTMGLSGLWGYLYLGWLPAFILALSLGKMPGLVLTVGLGVALSDVGAFCVGKALGGPKLAPHLSPGKTWSGVAGNVFGAALALALTAFAVPTLTLWQRGLFALVIGLGSVWGDLLESLLKRQRGVKDAGALLPGFGGLLDRVDSLLVVAPLVYYLSLLSK